MPTTDDLRRRRLAVVREHMETENAHDFGATLATFEHPRYEIVPTGDVFDRPEEVTEYYRNGAQLPLSHVRDLRVRRGQRPDRLRAGLLRPGDAARQLFDAEAPLA